MSNISIQLYVVEDQPNNLVCAHEFRSYVFTPTGSKQKQHYPELFKVTKKRILNTIEPGKGIRELVLPEWYVTQLGLGARRHAEEQITGSSRGDDQQLPPNGSPLGSGPEPSSAFVTSAHTGNK